MIPLMQPDFSKRPRSSVAARRTVCACNLHPMLNTGHSFEQLPAPSFYLSASHLAARVRPSDASGHHLGHQLAGSSDGLKLAARCKLVASNEQRA